MKAQGKTWHQLQEAHRRGGRQLWIFNVGDIKPIEIPMTFAMTLAWDINSIEAGNLAGFFTTMAERDFGRELSREVGAVWLEYDRLVSMRRHEHIEPNTFSLLNYNEAEIVLGRWKALLADSEAIYKRATETRRSGIFELVVYPVKASHTFIALQISLGRNQLYARQRRNSANKLAKEVLELFDADFGLSEEFHALLDGKWNHVMHQPHYGFSDTWHAPSRDMLSGLCYVQWRQNSNAIVGHMGVAVEGHEGVRPGRCNEESDRTHPSQRDLVPGVTLGTMTRYGPGTRWLDVYTLGSPTVSWTASTSYNWVKLSTTEGTLIPGEDDSRVIVTIDWNQVPATFNQEVLIAVRSAQGDFEQIHLPINGRQLPQSFKSGFVEGVGYISMPASSSINDFSISSYRALPDVGESVYGSVTLDPESGRTSSYLTYTVYVFTETAAPYLLLTST